MTPFAASNAAPRRHRSSASSVTSFGARSPARAAAPSAPTACAISSLPVYAKQTFNTGPSWCHVLAVTRAAAARRPAGMAFFAFAAFALFSENTSPSTRTRTRFSRITPDAASSSSRRSASANKPATSSSSRFRLSVEKA